MLLQSSLFLFVFLPVSVLVYHLLPGKRQNLWLLAVSAVFLFAAELHYALPMLLCGAADWFLLRTIKKGTGFRSYLFFWIGIAKDIGLILLYKQYVGFPEVYYLRMNGLELLVPLGLIVYVMKSIGILSDVYFRGSDFPESPIDFLLYLFFFPVLILGPVDSYTDTVPFLDYRNRVYDRERLLKALFRFSLGLWKLAFPARFFLEFRSTLLQYEPESLNLITGLMYLVSVTLGLYALWSGVRDTAVGISGFFGIYSEPAQDSPLSSLSPSELIQRCDDHLYKWIVSYPLSPEIVGGSSALYIIVQLILILCIRSVVKCDPPILIVWFCFAFLMLMLDRLVFPKLKDRLGHFLQGFMTLLTVTPCLYLFIFPSWSEAVSVFSAFLKLPETAPESFFPAGTLLPFWLYGILTLFLGLNGRIKNEIKSYVGRKPETRSWLILPVSVLMLGSVYIFM